MKVKDSGLVTNYEEYYFELGNQLMILPLKYELKPEYIKSAMDAFNRLIPPVNNTYVNDFTNKTFHPSMLINNIDKTCIKENIIHNFNLGMPLISQGYNCSIIPSIFPKRNVSNMFLV